MNTFFAVITYWLIFGRTSFLHCALHQMMMADSRYLLINAHNVIRTIHNYRKSECKSFAIRTQTRKQTIAREREQTNDLFLSFHVLPCPWSICEPFTTRLLKSEAWVNL